MSRTFRASVTGAAVAACLLATSALALDKCAAKINSKDGTILVSASGISGSLLWGNEVGDETNAFSNPACVADGAAKGCLLATQGTLAAITPPAGCTLYLKDDAAACSAFVKKCTPGLRDLGGADLEAMEMRVTTLEAMEGRVTTLESRVQRRVFVTSTGYDGNLGGLAGADALCNARAAAGGLAGSWTAWLSDTTTDAATRIGEGEFYDLNGKLLAQDLASLTDGLLHNGIELTEYGYVTGPPGNVWTGTNPDGTSAGDNCSDWTTSAPHPTVGASGYKGDRFQWTYNGGAGCDYPSALYCIR